ncbi:MAG: helix-turn-helix domain-containing protein [candidate division Zixibacteria bacterium]|nr:helix-turn-helix domain-containing protein [candidate division Zixibacteria bacterium]
MTEVDYYNKLKLAIDEKSLRYSLVHYADKNGIKPAARLFRTTPRTVRKWLNRWRETGDIVLTDRRALRTKRKSKIDETQKKKAIALKKRFPHYGSMRIKREFNLTISDKAVRKIWRQENLA